MGFLGFLPWIQACRWWVFVVFHLKCKVRSKHYKYREAVPAGAGLTQTVTSRRPGRPAQPLPSFSKADKGSAYACSSYEHSIWFGHPSISWATLSNKIIRKPQNISQYSNVLCDFFFFLNHCAMWQNVRIPRISFKAFSSWEGTEEVKEWKELSVSGHCII